VPFQDADTAAIVTMDTPDGKQSPDPFEATGDFQSRSAQRASVYLCYAPADQQAASIIAEKFESRGTPVWFTERDMTADMAWPQCVVEAIGNSKFFVLLLSEETLNTEDIIPEIKEARAAGRSILVLRSVDLTLNEELDRLLSAAHELRIEAVPTDVDIDAAWNRLVEIESNSTWDNDESAPFEDIDGAQTEGFIVQLECLRGSMSGTLSSHLGHGDRLIFGRGTDVDIRVEDHRASRHHAGMLVERDPKFGLELYLMDLMSRNGTWVRYRREGDPDISKFLEHTQVRIVSGAIVRIGSTDFRVNVARVPVRGAPDSD